MSRFEIHDSTQEILCRDIINTDVMFHQHDRFARKEFKFTRNQFIDMVNYWKVLLVEKYGAAPGKKIIIDSRYLYYFTAVFAVWELGMTLIVDWNHAYSEKDLDSAEYTMHGHIDYIICHGPYIDPTSELYQHWDLQRNKKYCKHIISDNEFDTYVIQNPSRFIEISQAILPKPTDIAIQTASSGSTGTPKLKKISHKEVCLQAYRLTHLLEFDPEDNILHSVTLHHGASACYHFLPSFIRAKNHHILWTNEASREEIDYRAGYIIDYQINKLFLYTTQQLSTYLDYTPPVNHKVDITTLFHITDSIAAEAKKKNISSIKSTFGDTTIGYGFLIKIWRQDHDLNDHDVSCMGPRRDDFFDLKIENGHLYVKSPALNINEWKTSQDKFEFRNDQYYFLGRDNAYRIGDEWINHGEIESTLLRYFPAHQGVETATVIVDNDQQQVYLAIWKDDSINESLFLDWINSRYKQLRINKIARGIGVNEFMGARKISRQKLREYFRSQP
jgi:acyl-coenzyme A synthetase/AMP-(fatty) acid ligase